jgi:hypothetical protein
MLDKYGNRTREVGRGFVEGEDSYCLSAVRKARKEYRCEGVIRAVRGAETFPLLAMLFFMVSPTIALRRSSKAIYMRS